MNSPIVRIWNSRPSRKAPIAATCAPMLWMSVWAFAMRSRMSRPDSSKSGPNQRFVYTLAWRSQSGSRATSSCT